MKRFIVAAALAAAAVPAMAAAVPPESTGGPLGPNACAVVGTPALPATCRFQANSQTVGSGGFAGPGAKITLTHKVKSSSCVNNVIVHAVNTVTDESVSGPNYLGSQESYISGVVYTLTITGPGFAIAGGPGTPSPAVPAEPADTPQDQTGGTTAGAPC